MIMEDGEDQVGHRTGMQQRYKGREGRQGLGSNRYMVVICGDSMVKETKLKNCFISLERVTTHKRLRNARVI